MSEKVIILDDVNFMFDKVELAHITKPHNEGMHYKEIAKKFKREPLEVVLALLHQASEEKVSLRTFGYIQV